MNKTIKSLQNMYKEYNYIPNQQDATHEILANFQYDSFDMDEYNCLTAISKGDYILSFITGIIYKKYLELN